MGSFWAYHQFIIAAFAACLVLIALSNWRLLRRAGDWAPPTAWPRVSVLVPARNEDVNIGDCVRSLLAQDLSLIHISEPTRLLSISYAVFCLKKKTTNIH